jgi:hypothetical protein
MKGSKGIKKKNRAGREALFFMFNISPNFFSICLSKECSRRP